jgi:hypothetical protein
VPFFISEQFSRHALPFEMSRPRTRAYAARYAGLKLAINKRRVTAIEIAPNRPRLSQASRRL